MTILNPIEPNESKLAGSGVETVIIPDCRITDMDIVMVNERDGKRYVTIHPDATFQALMMFRGARLEGVYDA